MSETHDKLELLLVTGLLGAGKTTALRQLEDLGWEMIDNFPLRFLKRQVQDLLAEGPGSSAVAIGFDARTREFVPRKFLEYLALLEARDDVSVTLLFVDCAGQELERRYNETRRPHPLAQGRPVHEALAAERELLARLRERADFVIDTTKFTPHDLQQSIREHFSPKSERRMALSVMSFGFARGIPPVADLVFDMRFLDNPHWDEKLRPLTGEDEAVARHIENDPAFADAYGQIEDLILTLLPRYEAQGRGYLTIAFGCTGGRHRSVFTARKLTERLRATGRSPTLIHRTLKSRGAELVEGTQPQP
ncbi:nucleotide-binding protein [Blastomonas marina]|uniref:Nucleotide-binding protein n=1 Tax=Blastomonas marina TaxID=1867408 RepID=A0ABQ1F6N1_9SPHN|nr:RNase adapter RapZ [Blastomonas marina]GGA01108.1 nucleotide-binding protein [Blastomonas marina]